MKSQNSHTDYCFLSLKILVAYERATCRAVRIDFCTHSAVGWGECLLGTWAFCRQTHPMHTKSIFSLFLESWKKPHFVTPSEASYWIFGLLRKKKFWNFGLFMIPGFVVYFLFFVIYLPFDALSWALIFCPRQRYNFIIFFLGNPPHSTLS